MKNVLNNNFIKKTVTITMSTGMFLNYIGGFNYFNAYNVYGISTEEEEKYEIASDEVKANEAKANELFAQLKITHEKLRNTYTQLTSLQEQYIQSYNQFIISRKQVYQSLDQTIVAKLDQIDSANEQSIQAKRQLSPIYSQLEKDREQVYQAGQKLGSVTNQFISTVYHCFELEEKFETTVEQLPALIKELLIQNLLEEYKKTTKQLSLINEKSSATVDRTTTYIEENHDLENQIEKMYEQINAVKTPTSERLIEVVNQYKCAVDELKILVEQLKDAKIYLRNADEQYIQSVKQEHKLCCQSIIANFNQIGFTEQSIQAENQHEQAYIELINNLTQLSDTIKKFTQVTYQLENIITKCVNSGKEFKEAVNESKKSQKRPRHDNKEAIPTKKRSKKLTNELTS